MKTPRSQTDAHAATANDATPATPSAVSVLNATARSERAPVKRTGNFPTGLIAPVIPRLGTIGSTTAPTLRIEMLTRDATPDYAGYIARHPAATLFHTPAWKHAVERTFPHEAVYLIARRGERAVGVLPMFLVRSRLAGRMLVSVPYGVGGGALTDNDETTLALLDEAVKLARHRACRMIDLRSEQPGPDGWDRDDRYVGFRRMLPACVDGILPSIPRKARAVVRNATRRFSLTVEHGDHHLRTVYRLYTINMRRLGSINYPYGFFESLVAGTPGRHVVSVTRYRGEPVAGLVSFIHRGCVLPYFYGASPTARRCGAAHLTYYKLMEWAVRHELTEFDFGRSRKNNTGSFQFKRLFGLTPHPLGYQKWFAHGSNGAGLDPDSPRFRLARRVWEKLPLTLTRPAGAYLSRHIPG